MADVRPWPELCAGTYRARQTSGTVMVLADGVHPTTGYYTFWVHEAPDQAPGDLALWHLRPSGQVLQVATPFAACISFQTTHDVRSVTVRDAVGVHTVSVEYTADALMHA